MIPKIPTTWKYARSSYLLLALCSVIYVLLNLYSPSSTADRLYHLPHLQLLLLQATIMIPMITIWFVALWGATTFKTYAIMIRGSSESRGLSLIADGLMWLLIYLVVLILSGAIAPYAAHTGWANGFVVARNHAPVLSSLMGFGLLYLGSHQLQITTPFQTWTRATLGLMLGMSVLAGIFAWLFLTTEPPHPINGLPAYVLPQGAHVFTLVLPYCWAWFLGLLAAFNLIRYAHRVKGVIYRQAIRHLAWGVAGAVVMVAAIQLLTLANRFLAQLKLGPLLLIIYAMLVICALGFWFIRSGARKLTRIEAVQ